MLTGDTWFVQVQGQVYGPYSTPQMHDFIMEDRIVPDSYVSMSPNKTFRTASEFSAFNPGLVKPAQRQVMGQDIGQAPDAQAQIIEPSLTLESPYLETPQPLNPNSNPANFQPRHNQPVKSQPFQTHTNQREGRPVDVDMFKVDDGSYLLQTVEAESEIKPLVFETDNDMSEVVMRVSSAPQNPVPVLNPAPAVPRAKPDTVPNDVKPNLVKPEIKMGEQNVSVVLVMAEFRSGQAMGFLQALQKQGTAQRIGDTVWLLRTVREATELRNILSQTMNREDRLFILDSFKNQTAWFNIGSDMDRRIREFWSMEPSEAELKVKTKL